jgi:hypothetical protein
MDFKLLNINAIVQLVGYLEVVGFCISICCLMFCFLIT